MAGGRGSKVEERRGGEVEARRERREWLPGTSCPPRVVRRGGRKEEVVLVELVPGDERGLRWGR